MKEKNQISVESIEDLEANEPSNNRKVTPFSRSLVGNHIRTDEELMKMARENVKMREAKKIGVESEDPDKIQL